MKHNAIANSKRIILSSLTAVLAISFSPLESKAAIEPVKTALITDSVAVMNVFLTRLDEIRTMDKSGLTLKEKRELRSEVRSINKVMHEHYGGVYISVGAVILIIVLLIILL
jgi:hypothetical protein